MENMFNRTDKFEMHILESIGGRVYFEMCAVGLDPIVAYHKLKDLEKEGKEVLLIVGNNTHFGYLVSYVLKDTEGEEHILTVEDALDKPVLAYVLNATDDFLSEYGFIQVTKIGDIYVRVY